MNRREFLKLSTFAAMSMFLGDFKLGEAKNFSAKKNRLPRARNFKFVRRRLKKVGN